MVRLIRAASHLHSWLWQGKVGARALQENPETPNNPDNQWVFETVMTELNTERSCPLPSFTNSLQEAAFLRFRVDAIVEEWIFPKTGKKIEDRSEYDLFHRDILRRLSR